MARACIKKLHTSTAAEMLKQNAGDREIAGSHPYLGGLLRCLYSKHRPNLIDLLLNSYQRYSLLAEIKTEVLVFSSSCFLV